SAGPAPRLGLGEVAARCPPFHMRTARIACPWGRKGAVMRRLIEETEDEERQLVDGVKVCKSDREWVLIIPHSDKPYFVITVESESEERAQALLTRYAELVERWRDAA